MFDAVQKLFNRDTADGVNHLASYLDRWLENELATTHPGMWNLNPRGDENLLSIKEQIKVERSGIPSDSPFAAELSLHFVQNLKNLRGTSFTLESNSAVDKHGLPRRAADRSSLEKRACTK